MTLEIREVIEVFRKSPLKLFFLMLMVGISSALCVFSSHIFNIPQSFPPRNTAQMDIAQ